jgi:succinate dehydrogenase / fumarate reductase, membrane anchor subunit
MSLRSPLGRVLGLGSAKDGAHHWWMQRVTSVALTLLSLWFVAALLSLGRLDYSSLEFWMSRPVNASLLALTVITVTYHSALGVQVVLEDYVSHKAGKVVTLIANQFLHLALGAIGVFSILRVAFGSAA